MVRDGYVSVCMACVNQWGLLIWVINLTRVTSLISDMSIAVACSDHSFNGYMRNVVI